MFREHSSHHIIFNIWRKYIENGELETNYIKNDKKSLIYIKRNGKSLEDWFLKNEKDMISLQVSNERGSASYYYHTPTKSFVRLTSSCWYPPHYFVVSKVDKDEAEIYNMLTNLLQNKSP